MAVDRLHIADNRIEAGVQMAALLNHPKPVAVPDSASLASLVRDLLLRLEERKGAPLTEQEILEIRNTVATTRLSLSKLVTRQ